MSLLRIWPSPVPLRQQLSQPPGLADLAIMGEVGLSGELRSVGQLSRRVQEAAKLGFTRALTPRTVSRQRGSEVRPSGIEVIGVRTLQEALEVASQRGKGGVCVAGSLHCAWAWRTCCLVWQPMLRQLVRSRL